MEIKEYLFEEWRPVAGYEGLYEVSNFGRVRSLERDCITGRGGVHHLKEKYLILNKKRLAILKCVFLKMAYENTTLFTVSLHRPSYQTKITMLR